MSTKQKRKMKVDVVVVRKDRATGEGKVDCFDLNEDIQVDPEIVIGHVLKRGVLPTDAKMERYYSIADQDRCGSGYLYGYEDKANRFYWIILHSDDALWGEDLSFCTIEEE